MAGAVASACPAGALKAHSAIAINGFIEMTNANPTPYVWTAGLERVLTAVKRGRQGLKSVHERARNSEEGRTL